ncbi:inhibitor of apoptosis domain-containing protein [Elsinoe australis]|uniref:Inhibitor of apoptosis domain-containing protein n=1 Tax=Elsinoe australis TaxID=40998 RepID=A0A4U7AY91_9PEZI|nr:inhibitor of apoptosis domain-containing protein [Elsinoe australis]
MADPATDMRMFENRLATFQEQDHPAKKVQTSQGKGVPKSWPHETPTAIDLALAGFYFAPTSHSQDNVKCFHCEVKLDGWEIDDSPLREHIAHSPNCAWAVATSVSLGEQDQDPNSERLLNARIETFGSSWPYEKKRGWKPKSKKLAEAGWIMDPSLRAEDGTTCFYCQLSLDGWEPKDDPIEEHRKRSKDCTFFDLLDKYASQRPKKSRARNSSASKASRLSTQSIQSTFSEAPSFMSLGDAAPPLEGDTSIGTVTSTTSTTKGRKKATGTKKGSKSKKKGTAESMADNTEMETAMTNLDETLAPSQSILQGTQEEPMVEVKQEPVKKTTRGKGKGKKAAAKTVDETEDQSQLQSELAASVVEPEPKKPATRAKRGKKRTSDGEEKPQDIQEATLEPAPSQIEPVEEVPVKGKKGKATRGKKVKTSPEEPTQDIEPVEEQQHMEVEIEELPVEVKEEAPKPKRGRKPKATKPAKEPTPEPEPIVEPEPQPEPQPEAQPELEEPAQDESSNFVVHPGEEESEANYVVHDESSANFIVHDQTPEPAEFEPTPTPQKAPVARSPSPPAASAHSTPQSVRSTQSSDAENHPPPSNPRASKRISATTTTVPPPAPSPPVNTAPPASLPAPQLSPTKTTRVPLASQTPNRSPSKRSPTKLGYLKTSTPWTATDIETIFFGQENEGAAGGAGGGVARKLAELGGQLSSPEKKMTVEEWVRFQARKGEERLKEECERLVWLFEKEGTRALGVLGGVEVRGES